MFLRAFISAGSLVTVPMVSMATMSRVYAAESLDEPKAKMVDSTPVSNTDGETPKAKDPVLVQLEKLKESKKDRTVLINQLPLYGEPPKADIVYMPEKEEALRKHVSVIRQAVWRELDRFEGTWTVVKDNYRSGKKYTQDLVQYLREDAGALPRATFITVSGLGGVILGYKGGVVRRTLFAAGGLTGAAAICYPPQAIDISRWGWAYTQDQARSLYQKMKTDPANTVPEKPAAVEDVKQSASTKDTVKVSVRIEQEPSAQPKKDFGMSKEEDKDMYSTRSS